MLFATLRNLLRIECNCWKLGVGSNRVESDERMPSGSRRDAAAEWLLSRINYERTNVVPYGERQLKLDRMRTLVTCLGQPDAALKIVHVAGTKGKGSTSAMIAAMSPA